MVFGPEGIWARFLRQAEGFIATDMKQELPGDGRYRVRDFWTGHRGFEIFRERYSEEFSRFDQEILDGLVEKQQFVGAYYEADGDDLVSA